MCVEVVVVVAFERFVMSVPFENSQSEELMNKRTSERLNK